MIDLDCWIYQSRPEGLSSLAAVVVCRRQLLLVSSYEAPCQLSLQTEVVPQSSLECDRVSQVFVQLPFGQVSSIDQDIKS